MIPGSEGSDFEEIVFIPPTTKLTTSTPIPEHVTPDWKQVTRGVRKRKRLLINFDPRRKIKPRSPDRTSKQDQDIIIDERSKEQENTSFSVTTEIPPESTRKYEYNQSQHRKLRNRKLRKEISLKLGEINKPDDSFIKDESQVTITIGGTPFIIPDFDLKPKTNKYRDNIQYKTQTDSKPTLKVTQVKHQRRSRNRKKTNTDIEENNKNSVSLQTTTLKTKQSNSYSGSLKAEPSHTDFVQQKEEFETTTSKIYTPKSSKTSIRSKKPRLKYPGHSSQTVHVRSTSPPSKHLYRTIPQSCPDSLEVCVNTCATLLDVYAYSACVVECGDRC